MRLRTNNQKEISLANGDIAWVVKGEDYAQIRQIKIEGRCEDGPGYEGVYTSFDPQFLDGSRHIHTCNLYLACTIKEAQKVALEINKEALAIYRKKRKQIQDHTRYLDWAVRHPSRIAVD